MKRNEDEGEDNYFSGCAFRNSVISANPFSSAIVSAVCLQSELYFAGTPLFSVWICYEGDIEVKNREKYIDKDRKKKRWRE